MVLKDFPAFEKHSLTQKHSAAPCRCLKVAMVEVMIKLYYKALFQIRYFFNSTVRNSTIRANICYNTLSVAMSTIQ